MNKEIILSELQFKAVRSSGSGGQNVNKVSSKVMLSFDVISSSGLEVDEKELITKKLNTKLTNENVLILNCDEDRSQLKNKEIVIKRFFEMIEKALTKTKKRKPTVVPKSVVEKRIKEKKSNAEIKQSRKKPDF
ncbi:aminoacyl-tRNA hydrolase [Flavobacterium lutivivi]|nr:aminoacyl-tRNA hydrolase [Flavobacterium lutivivi]